VLVALGAGLAGAGRAELEALADWFLAERAVSVVADRALEERRWSTPDLLAVEDRLVTSATGRTGEQTAVVSHEAVGEALTAQRTAGADQRAMVRDVCQGGQGVAVVVGRAGTGKPSPSRSPGTPGSWTRPAGGCGSDSAQMRSPGGGGWWGSDAPLASWVRWSGKDGRSYTT
jgi:hypothetical protein